MSKEMKALNVTNAHEQYVKVERDRVWAQGYASGWNSAIYAALEKLNESPDPGINYWIEQIRKLKK